MDACNHQPCKPEARVGSSVSAQGFPAASISCSEHHDKMAVVFKVNVIGVVRQSCESIPWNDICAWMEQCNQRNQVRSLQPVSCITCFVSNSVEVPFDYS